jgi:Domain of unknown function (DUF5666)
MKRIGMAVALTTLALPASALAASSSGTVLSVDSGHHMIQVVDGRHVVHAFHYRGKLGRLHAGSQISFRNYGQSIGAVKVVSSQSRTVSFLGQVVRSSSHGLVLRLADGKTITFGAGQIRHKRPKPSQRHKHLHAAGDLGISAGGVTVNIQGLQPGVTVLITETVDGSGNVTITISLPPAGTGTPAGNTGEQSASGVISQVNTDTFDLTTGDGSDLRLHMSASQLSNLNLNVCDTADVTYHQDAGLLIADTVNDNGQSTSGDCAPQQTSQDEVGAITAVSSSSITLNTTDNGPMTFSVDPSSGLTDGFVLGDVVDVSFTQNSDGSNSASDVEYVEQDSTGTVTSVSDGSLTITDSSTGQPDTFTADPTAGMFDGVALGDQVDVTYHTSSGQLVADAVDDQSGGQGQGD